MLVAEIFHSIQGEGLLTGTPSVFIRTSGCNLRCDWCDTPYASWDPEGEELTVEETVRRALQYPSRHVVLTGGEPMIARGVKLLADRLCEAGRHVTIETAATVPPGGIACDLASLSPKLANSAPGDRLPPGWRARHEERRLRPDVIREWVRNYPYQLKFVVAQESDLEEIEQILDSVGHPIPADRVLLMPEGTDEATLKARTGWLTEICRRRGYHLCARLHIALYGNTRGT